jgi:hypothetical protein
MKRLWITGHPCFSLCYEKNKNQLNQKKNQSCNITVKYTTYPNVDSVPIPWEIFTKYNCIAYSFRVGDDHTQYYVEWKFPLATDKWL